MRAKDWVFKGSGVQGLGALVHSFSLSPLLALAVAWALLTGCHSQKTEENRRSADPPPVTFRDVTEEAGIRFRHVNGAAGKKYIPETMGAGGAFLDYDNDGWLDVLLVNGTHWPEERAKRSTSSAQRPTLRLFRNEGQGRFIDVTAAVRLDVEMYGMGVAVGDYDNDGWEDLYVTGVGRSRLFHNEAFRPEPPRPRTPERRAPSAERRVFQDVTSQAGVSSPGWATSATWIDYDRDGWLDLFVCHYVQWTPETDQFFSVDGIHKSYATPQQYLGETCRLYRNRGVQVFRRSGVQEMGEPEHLNARTPQHPLFEDVTKAAGIYNPRSKALGVVLCDMDQDGLPDLVVANDTEPNFLFHNQGDGTFKEVALETGIAVTEAGKAKAGMGIDAGDEQNTGQDSIVITNFAGEQLTLYRRDASGQYLDVAARSGIGNATQLYLGFGVFFFDYDADGWLDILVANGHIQDDADTRATGVAYREPALLFRNVGGGRFQDVTRSTGEALLQPEVGRGAAWGDYDNDGDPDILLTANNGPARLLRNENRTGHHWLRLELVGGQSNRSAIGARVRVRAGGMSMTQTVKGASSYLSQSDRRLLFGLGAATQADAIEIQWPSGRVQTLGPTPADRTLVIREGEALAS